MSSKAVPFTCPRCGHTWSKKRSVLDEQKQVVFRGRDQKKAYRDLCSRCGTYAVTEIEE